MGPPFVNPLARSTAKVFQVLRMVNDRENMLQGLNLRVRIWAAVSVDAVLSVVGDFSRSSILGGGLGVAPYDPVGI